MLKFSAEMSVLKVVRSIAFQIWLFILHYIAQYNVWNM